MEVKISKKINYLAYLNLGLGFISFFAGLTPLLIFISTFGYAFTMSRFWDSYFFNFLYDFYRNSMETFHLGLYVTTCIFGLFGISTLVIGLVASIFINDKLQRGVAFVGNIFGTFGIIGNLIGLVLVSIPTS